MASVNPISIVWTSCFFASPFEKYGRVFNLLARAIRGRPSVPWIELIMDVVWHLVGGNIFHWWGTSFEIGEVFRYNLRVFSGFTASQEPGNSTTKNDKHYYQTQNTYFLYTAARLGLAITSLRLLLDLTIICLRLLNFLIFYLYVIWRDWLLWIINFLPVIISISALLLMSFGISFLHLGISFWLQKFITFLKRRIVSLKFTTIFYERGIIIQLRVLLLFIWLVQCHMQFES